MSDVKMYDYFSGTVTPDYTGAILTLNPTNTLVEEGDFNQITHVYVDGSRETKNLSSTPVFYVTLQWKNRSTSDAGTIFDFYFSTSKAYGMARSFKWTHFDGYTYTVKFASKLGRKYDDNIISLMSLEGIKLLVLGVAPP